MTTSLADLGEALKRAVAVPGSFDDSFDMGDAEILGSLLDGFAEAQLDGFFSGMTAEDDGELSSEIDRAAGALIVIYSSSQILTSVIRDLKSHVKYVAGAVSFEQDSPASVMVQLLRDANARKKEMREEAKRSGAGAAFYFADRYVAQVMGNGGFL